MDIPFKMSVNNVGIDQDSLVLGLERPSIHVLKYKTDIPVGRVFFKHRYPP